MCGNCKQFIPNGCFKSFDIIYHIKNPSKCGNCAITKELKNEMNICEEYDKNKIK